MLALNSTPALAIERVDGVLVLEPVGETRRVDHQIVHGDGTHERLRRERIGVAACEHPRIGERGDELRDRIVELKAALLVEHQRRHGRDRLGHRVDAIDGVRFDRALRLDVAIATGLEPGEAIVAHDGDEQPGKLSRVHPPPHPWRDPCKVRGREPDLLGSSVDLHYSADAAAAPGSIAPPIDAVDASALRYVMRYFPFQLFS